MTDKPESKEGPKADATGEFFVIGSPLHAVRASYIRRNADDELFETVIRGGYAHVIAPDRSGKSSLIAATSARLQNNGVKVAVIDLKQISERDGGNDAGRWYYNIAYRLLRQLRLKIDLQTWWQDKAIVSNRQRLVEFYVEIVLSNIQEPVVIFIDEIQCIEDIPFDEHLLASIRAAHNSRVTDPEFTRLSFVLLGECDPHSLVSTQALSPFAVSTEIRLDDFTREDLHAFREELNLNSADAKLALDRIYDWTGGQPYLTQKLARSIARESISGDIKGNVDRIVLQQLAGRAALHSEPHMSHIHRRVVRDRKLSETILTLYGKMRKGMPVIYDPESPAQRELFAVGLVRVDADGQLIPRNKVYARVFTAKWANENLPIHWRGPAIAVSLVLIILAIPFWYTQILPAPHVRLLSTTDAELSVVADAWQNMRSFPGHATSADHLYQSHLRIRSQRATSRTEIERLHMYASRMQDGKLFADELTASFWDRAAKTAMRSENRDDALIAAMEALVIATPERRQLAANLVGDDYPQLIGTVPSNQAERVFYDPENNLLSFVTGAKVTQWSMANNTLQPRANWSLSALEVTPLVRRLVIDRGGSVRSISLKVALSHARKDDLRLKLISPSGRTVDLEFGGQPLLDNMVVFPGAELSEMIGEAIPGTWSLSVRDESTAATGSLANWSLSLNGQTFADVPEREISIPDPVARESNEIWFSRGGRYAVARAMHSDSARLWDLLYAQPARSIAVPANERVLGLSANAEFLLSAGQDTISLWKISNGRRHSKKGLAAAGAELSVSDNGRFLFMQSRGDARTKFELWSIEAERTLAELTVAGTPALYAVSDDGSRIAVADYDRGVRVWELLDKRLIAQIALELQPSRILLSSNGETLGVLHGEQGISLWSVAQPSAPLVLERGQSDWHMAFSPSGSRLIAGNSRDGFQVYRCSDGAIAGPPIGSELTYGAGKLLAFSNDELTLVTAGPGGIARFWKTPSHRSINVQQSTGHRLWRESGDSVTAIATGGKRLAIGDYDGHVHILEVHANDADLESARDEISYIGHQDKVSALTFSSDGLLVASADPEGVIRIWDSLSGLPRPFRTTTAPTTTLSMVFSPDNSRLAVLGGRRIWVADTASGELVFDIDLGDLHNDMAFGSDSQLYLAAEDGSLRSLAADRTESWNLRVVWSGEIPLRHVAVSPRQQYVVVTDAQNRASLLDVHEGTIGRSVLQLPDAVQDILFSPNETNVLFRTARWIHQASLAKSGINWADALRAPKALTGSRMVLDTLSSGDASIDPLGGDIALLTRDTGFAEVAELHFSPADGGTLIGSYLQLLDEWRVKLGRVTDSR